MNLNRIYSTIDTQVFGEAFRIVTSSSIQLAPGSIEEMQAELDASFAFEKNLLLNEPRGHRGMNGCLVVGARQADVGLVFFNHQAAVTFKHEAVLAVTTALLELGKLTCHDNDEYQVQTAFGTYSVNAPLTNGEVLESTVRIDRAELVEQGKENSIVCVGENRNYHIYRLPPEISALELAHLAEVEQWGKRTVSALAKEQVDVSGVVLVDQLQDGKVRSVTFERDGYILRSPGVDTSVALALVTAQSELENTTIFNSALTVKQSNNEGEDVFSVTGEAFVTGSHDFLLDDDDPLPHGFLLA